MFAVYLFLFPVLLYNTEALPAANSEDDYWYPLNTAWDTSIDINASESFAVENNYSYSVPADVVAETIIVPTSKSIRMYGVNTTIKPTTDDDDEPTNHTETNDSYSITTEREFSRNITTIPNSWYNGTVEVSETSTRISYDSYWGKLLQNNTTTTPDSWYIRTAEVSETTTAKIPHDRYSGKFGSITLENGILTAHLPETDSAEEIPLTTGAVPTPKRPTDWWTYKYGTTTTTGRPYYNPHYGSYRPMSTITPDSWHDKTAEVFETTTTGKFGTTTTTGRPYYNSYYGSYRQNTTTEDATTPKRPTDWWSYKYGTTTTTGRPYYNPHYGSYRPISTITPDSWHDKTAEVFETTTTGKFGTTTTTGRPYYNSYYGSYRQNTTTEDATTPKRPTDWWSYKYGTTTTTGRPYYNPHYGSYRPMSTITPDSWHDKTAEVFETTTTGKFGTTTTTGRPYYNSYYGSYRQNTTTEDTTTPKRPTDWWSYKYGTITTTGRPYYNPHYGSYRPMSTITPDSWHDKTAEVFETTTTGKFGTTTTTGRPYYNSYYGSYRQNTTTEDTTTPKRPTDWWSYKYGTITTTGRPYYNPHYGSYRPISTITPDSWHDKTAEVFETTTTGKFGTTTTTGRPYYNSYYGSYRQNTTTEDTTTPKRPTDWWSYKYGTITTTGRPYYNPHYGSYRPISTITPDSWHDKTAEVFETTTTGKFGTTTTTGRPYYNSYYGSYRQNTTTEDTTTPKRPTDWWSYKYGTITTTGRPYYNPHYGSYRPISTITPDSWHDKTAEVFETTTTGKPNSWFIRGLRAYFRNITTPNFWYNKTPENSETTTAARSYNRYWPRREYSTPTSDSWHEYSTWYTTRYPSTTTDAYEYTWYPKRTADRYTYTWYPASTTDTYEYTWYPERTKDRYIYTWYPTTTPVTITDTYQYNTNKTTETTDQANRTPPVTTCRSCSPKNISNSTINTNDRGNYGKLIDLLKKNAENILPSTISIAPNSNVTHLTVASGNGNMFIYLNN